ncbi:MULTISPECIES: hypothetical protein [Nostoc]|uniref:Asparagine synthetase domain-containing protein n=2 Tax=Nostoc TaxID=1177 RepID=A0ABR8IBP1_9NOSO|nr:MULTISPECIES: hypothetical protein [Nostoc]MBD2562915.1 hypothetical protein [Nostoc linckia FACHB-391]MBD2648817.1 hypothetical protein [Nostoc foliaceum FACHB-393]
MTINHDVLIQQFILCKTENNIPENWNIRRNSSWCLGFHQDLPVIEILASDSSFIGWLLGYPINTNGLLLKKSLQMSVSLEDSSAASQLESSLYAFGGRFVAIFLTGNISRVYLDPLGSLAIVFCAEQQIAASSTVLIPYSEDSKDNYELINSLDIPIKDNWYPFGLTPRHSVERLLPNHFLDLDNWQSTRHWLTDEITTAQDVDSSIYEIGSIVKNNIAAFAKNAPVYMALTAGRDSRMLLACAREYLQNIEFFTIRIPTKGGRLDCEVASQMAKRFKLNYRVIEFEEATETELNEWLYRTGNCVAGNSWKNARTIKQLDSSRGLLLGLAGEVGRSLYWRVSDTESTYLSPSELLRRIDVPATPYLKEQANKWLSNLPIKNTFTVLDIVFIELRLGCWAGPQQYGHVNNAFRISPFSHRKIMEIMLSLPPDYKRHQMLTNDLIKRFYPELLMFPFNEPIGIQRYLWLLKNGDKLINIIQKKQVTQQLFWENPVSEDEDIEVLGEGKKR